MNENLNQNLDSKIDEHLNTNTDNNSITDLTKKSTDENFIKSKSLIKNNTEDFQDNTAQPIVQFFDVRKNFDKKVALRNINLKIPKGKIVGLLGPNGSGKTTMIKLINGLLQSDNGGVLINGKTPSIETKKIISYLPDKNTLNNWMKVKDILEFFNDFYEDFDMKLAINMLADLNIDLNDRLKTLSKGTKEKVQLILVMSRKAQLYILDEPIGGVDPAARSYIIKTILQNYSNEGTLLIATHLISEIENICDEVIFISEGDILLQGSTDKIREEYGMSIDALFREEFKC
ncbi:MAG: ABC transporter ATP-binding protein [Clostridioides sp.]|jgi:ABC-2 type transport system ATP-binding protein|nr:ABC transporter ATP-binding protein [Clostridioides sp.]